MNYDDFLHSKIEVAPISGFSVSPGDINPALKPHQKDAVLWAVKGGRRALFESFCAWADGAMAVSWGTLPMRFPTCGRRKRKWSSRACLIFWTGPVMLYDL